MNIGNFMRQIREEEADKVIKIFIRNYKTCHKAFSVTKSESIKNDLHQRMSQIVLMYSEIFDISVLAARNELDAILGNQEIPIEQEAQENAESLGKEKMEEFRKKEDCGIDLKENKKGCSNMFQPWGESEEESWWKCGDEHNGEPLLCSNCKEKEKEVVKE